MAKVVTAGCPRFFNKDPMTLYDILPSQFCLHMKASIDCPLYEYPPLIPRLPVPQPSSEE